MQARGIIELIAIVPSGLVVDMFELIERYVGAPLFGSMAPLL